MTTQAKRKQETQRGGPTAYRSEYAEQARKFGLLKDDLSDRELAEFFGVDESTIGDWKRKYPEFSAAVESGKIRANAEVAASLHKRCVGYFVTETKAVRSRHVEYDAATGKKVREWDEWHTIAEQRYIPPSDTAILYYLSNLYGPGAGWGRKAAEDDRQQDGDGRDHLRHLAARFGVTPQPDNSNEGGMGE